MLPALLPALLPATGGAQAHGAGEPVRQTRTEGALGLTLHHRPEVPGASAYKLGATPGFFLRLGRFTLSNASGFVTRSDDDVDRGLGLELVERSRLRVGASLRFDRGRQEASSAILRGMGDVPQTVRTRVSGSYLFGHGWRVGGSWSVDSLGRGGGNLGDLSLQHEKRWTRDTTVVWTASVTAAGDRYLQTYYGVNREQSLRSGYPMFHPGNGLRDVSVGLSVRQQFGRQWVATYGAGTTLLVGPAADSPLVRDRQGFGLSAGVARRF